MARGGDFDAVVVGAGPNGLAAAIVLAQANLSVLVLEAEPTIGGGTRTEELTLPGFHHDVCSAIHPMAAISPFFASLPLHEHGLTLVHPPVALAHPFDDGTAATLDRDPETTAREFESVDEQAWCELFIHYMHHPSKFLAALLEPIRIPRHPREMARFGWVALRSASSIARRYFRSAPPRALFAGCAAHAMVPLDRAGTASFGMVLALSAYASGWPIAKGGSSAVTSALASILTSLGGVVRTGERVTSLAQIPSSRAVLFDVMPRQLAAIAGDELPRSYVDELLRYRHGPGIFKIDWALDGPIPWVADACHRTATLHLGPSLEDLEKSEADVGSGRITERPFVLVAQPSLFDGTRAPSGKHTGWAYCHVPNGSTVDMTEAIERQVERFAPGFRDRILQRSTMTAMQVEAHDAGFIGGDIGGGANDLGQVLARPVLRWNPYQTPNRRLYLASSATPPGGGVHGMCGYWAARAALARSFDR